jgi:hypothetical protein
MEIQNALLHIEDPMLILSIKYNKSDVPNIVINGCSILQDASPLTGCRACKMENWFQISKEHIYSR